MNSNSALRSASTPLSLSATGNSTAALIPQYSNSNPNPMSASLAASAYGCALGGYSFSSPPSFPLFSASLAPKKSPSLPRSAFQLSTAPTGSKAKSVLFPLMSPPLFSSYFDEALFNKFQEIVPRVYLGSLRSAMNKRLLRDNGITHILTVSNTMNPVTFAASAKVTKKFIRLDDEIQANLLSILPEAVDFITNALASGEDHRVLVHCYAGVSRSASVIIAYLMSAYRLAFRDAFQTVRSKRCIIQPNPGFQRQLQIFEGKVLQQQLQQPQMQAQNNKQQTIQQSIAVTHPFTETKTESVAAFPSAASTAPVPSTAGASSSSSTLTSAPANGMPPSLSFLLNDAQRKAATTRMTGIGFGKSKKRSSVSLKSTGNGPQRRLAATLPNSIRKVVGNTSAQQPLQQQSQSFISPQMLLQ